MWPKSYGISRHLYNVIYVIAWATVGEIDLNSVDSYDVEVDVIKL